MTISIGGLKFDNMEEVLAKLSIVEKRISNIDHEIGMLQSERYTLDDLCDELTEFCYDEGVYHE